MRSSSSASRASRPRRASAGRAAALLLGLAATLASSGCYTTHVAAGQLGILLGREPIDEAIDDPALPPVDRDKLRLVRDVRRFAIERLGLAETGSYTSVYDTGDRPVAWNVSASDPDAFAPYTWDFPIVGTMPYIGFFDEEKADEEGRRLRERGLDALVLPVPAYSTLGWFDDPFFTSMLKYDEATIADIIVHELAHATVFIDSDAEFNETLATFIGQAGAEAYFLARGGEADPALAVAREDTRQRAIFNASLAGLRDTLWRVYESTAPREEKLRRKAEEIAAWRAKFVQEVRPQLSEGSYDYVLDDEVEFNNAFLLAFQRYHGELDLFEELHSQNGRDLPATIRALEELAEEDDPRAALAERVAQGRVLLAGPAPTR